MPNYKKGNEIKEVPAKAHFYSAADIDKIIENAIAPIDAHEDMESPELYVERRLGKYIHILEAMLNQSLLLGNFDRAQSLTNDLIRLTKMGRAKAEIAIGPSKLRDETDFSKWDTDKIKELIKGAESVRDKS